MLAGAPAIGDVIGPLVRFCGDLPLLGHNILFDYSFIVASIFLGTVTLLFTKSKRKLYYVIVMITVIVLYLLFTQVLHVRLK